MDSAFLLLKTSPFHWKKENLGTETYLLNSTNVMF